jgi:hypothetical protein
MEHQCTGSVSDGNPEAWQSPHGNGGLGIIGRLEGVRDWVGEEGLKGGREMVDFKKEGWQG